MVRVNTKLSNLLLHLPLLFLPHPLRIILLYCCSKSYNLVTPQTTIPPVPVSPHRVPSGKHTASTSFKGKQCPNSTRTSQFIIGASLNEQLNLPTNNIICSFNTIAWSISVCRPVDVCVFQLFDIVGRRH